MQIYTVISLLSVTLAAFVSDSRKGIIPNRLCFFCLILVPVSRAAEQRWFSGSDLAGISFLIGLLLFMYRIRGLGGGDVKLFAALFLLLPVKNAILLIWVTMLLAGTAGAINYFRWKERYIRLGPAVFMASLVIAGIGGCK